MLETKWFSEQSTSRPPPQERGGTMQYLGRNAALDPGAKTPRSGCDHLRLLFLTSTCQSTCNCRLQVSCVFKFFSVLEPFVTPDVSIHFICELQEDSKLESSPGDEPATCWHSGDIILDSLTPHFMLHTHWNMSWWGVGRKAKTPLLLGKQAL